MTDSSNSFYANPGLMAQLAQSFPDIANAAQRIGYEACSDVEAGVPAFGTDSAGQTFTYQAVTAVIAAQYLLNALGAVCQQAGQNVEDTANVMQLQENGRSDLAAQLAQITGTAITTGPVHR